MSRFGMKEVAQVTLFDYVTQRPALFFDTLKMSNLELAGETVYATGGQGANRLIGWDYNKTATFSMQDSLLSMQSLAALSGDTVKTGVTVLRGREVLVAVLDGTGTKVTMSQAPNATGLYVVKTTDGVLHLGDVTPTTVTGMDISFDASDVAVGEQVIVYFQYNSTVDAKTVQISASKFPGYYTVVGNTLVRGENGKDTGAQIVIYKAKLQPTFTLTMDAENVSVFDFNLEVFKDEKSDAMVDIIKL
jgi:hypothetical protein